ncbi:MAG: hypothetical protein KIG88_03990 [Weeksellaceae bacterium]|nr:hypothetical protein [Weeksellaceae bacterium]
MKKMFVLAAVGGLAFVACKTETDKTVITDANADTVAVVETTTEVGVVSEAEAKAAVDKAQADLNAAIAKGDKAAEEAARKALDDANVAWESAKNAVGAAAQDVKEGVNNAADAVDAKAQDVKADVKNATAEAKEDINKAAQDTKESVNKAAEDAKQGINNTLEKAKIK